MRNPTFRSVLVVLATLHRINGAQIDNQVAAPPADDLQLQIIPGGPSITPGPPLPTGYSNKSDACLPQCKRCNGFLYTLGWSALSITATVTLETVVTFVDRKNNATRVVTSTNSNLGNVATPTNTNSLGFQTTGTVVTDQKAKTISTINVVFPSVFIEYSNSYALSGLIGTTAGGKATCTSLTDAAYFTYPAQPIIPQRVGESIDQDRLKLDPKGLTFVPQYDAWHPNERTFITNFLKPLNPDLLMWACEDACGALLAPSTVKNGALYLSDHTTQYEDGANPAPNPVGGSPNGDNPGKPAGTQPGPLSSAGQLVGPETPMPQVGGAGGQPAPTNQASNAGGNGSPNNGNTPAQSNGNAGTQPNGNAGTQPNGNTGGQSNGNAGAGTQPNGNAAAQSNGNTLPQQNGNTPAPQNGNTPTQQNGNTPAQQNGNLGGSTSPQGQVPAAGGVSGQAAAANIIAAPGAILTVGSKSFTADNNNNFASGSVTIKSGSPVTIDGTPVSIGAGVAVVGSSTQTLPKVTTPAQLIAGAPTFIPNSDGKVVINGQTLAPGSAISNNGGVVTMKSDGAVLSVSAAATQTLLPANQAGVGVGSFSFGAGTITANKEGQYMIGGQTLTKGATITVSGTPIALGADGGKVTVGTQVQNVKTSAANTGSGRAGVTGTPLPYSSSAAGGKSSPRVARPVLLMIFAAFLAPR